MRGDGLVAWKAVKFGEPRFRKCDALKRRCLLQRRAVVKEKAWCEDERSKDESGSELL